MPDKKLDFIVIGAAKAATTSLHELIKNHPGLYIPSAKEVPYFSDEKIYKKGFKRYLQDYFSDADPNKLWGTITPQYMLGEEYLTSDTIAERIKKELPNVKLVALLRNPAERAFSHYNMQVQRGYEARDFREVIDQDLKFPAKTRKQISSKKSYIFGSEYGRILKTYCSLFPKKNILVLTTDELRDSPDKTLRKLFTFLGIDTAYRPENTAKKHRKGGASPKVKFLTPGFLFKIPFLKTIWKNLVPRTLRKKTEYFLNLWNTKAGDTKLDKNSQEYKRLVNFYNDDTKLLESLSKKKMPWSTE